MESILPDHVCDPRKDSQYEMHFIKACVNSAIPWKDFCNMENQAGTSYIQYYPIHLDKRVTLYQMFVEEPWKKENFLCGDRCHGVMAFVEF